MSQWFEISRRPDVERLWSLQAGQCALCGKRMLRSRFETGHPAIWTRQRATIDHIVPRAKGGRDDPGNYQLAHANCNKRKGATHEQKGAR